MVRCGPFALGLPNRELLPVAPNCDITHWNHRFRKAPKANIAGTASAAVKALQRAHIRLASRRFVQRRQDRGKPLLYLGAPSRMRKYVEFILAYCGEDLQSYMRRFEPGLYEFGYLGGHCARRGRGVEGLRRSVALRAIAPALEDPGTNKPRTEDGHPNTKRL
jgi:hypothetical protein